MPCVSKTAFLQPMDLKREKVSLPEWGADAYVWLKELSADYIRALQKVHGKEGDTDHVGFVSSVVSRTAVNDEGERLFTEADVERLSAKSFRLLQALCEQAIKLSGLDTRPKN